MSRQEAPAPPGLFFSCIELIVSKPTASTLHRIQAHRFNPAFRAGSRVSMLRMRHGPYASVKRSAGCVAVMLKILFDQTRIRRAPAASGPEESVFCDVSATPALCAVEDHAHSAEGAMRCEKLFFSGIFRIRRGRLPGG